MHYAGCFLNREIPRYLPLFCTQRKSILYQPFGESKVPSFVSATEDLSRQKTIIINQIFIYNDESAAMTRIYSNPASRYRS